MNGPDVEKMLVELETGKPPSDVSPEACILRAKLIKECADIRAKGGTVLVPHEIPGERS